MTLVRGMIAPFLIMLSAAPDATKTVWGTNSYTVTGASAPALSQVAGNLYSCRLSPDTVGTWFLAVYDAGGALVGSESFRVVDAHPEQVALGVVPPNRALAVYYPSLSMVNGTAVGTPRTLTTGSNRAFVSAGKNLIAVSGHVFGIQIGTGSAFGLANLTTYRFITVDPATGMVRGRSENLVGKTFTNPDTGATVSATATSPFFKQVLFDVPVRCVAGDWWGIEVENASGSTQTIFWDAASQTGATGAVQVQQIRATAGALSLTGANTFTQFGVLTTQFQIKLLINPPAIALIGVSTQAGSTESSPPTANSPYAYSRTQDPGWMMSERLGVPVLNLAYGGSKWPDWDGNDGYFETLVTPMRPAVVVADMTLRNWIRDLNPTDAQVLAACDELLVRCAQIGAELVVAETVVDRLVATEGIAARIEEANALVAQWCDRNGVCWIPLASAIGQPLAGSTSTLAGDPSRRREHKGAVNGTPQYNYADPGDQNVHLTLAGRRGWANAVCGALKHRTRLSQFARDTTTAASVVPPKSLARLARNAGSRSKR